MRLRRHSALAAGWMGFGGLATAAYFVAGNYSRLAQAVVYDAVAVVAAAVIVLGVRIWRPINPGAWYLIAAGMALWGIGDIIWAVYEHALHELVPFPSLADVAYLAGYPVMGLGVLRLVRDRSAGGDRAGLLDALLVATAVSVPSWLFFMEPYARDSSLRLVDQLISVAYPAMDIVLLAVVMRLVLSPGRRGPSFWLLGASGVTVLAGDVAYAVETLRGTYYSGHWLDSMYLVSYVLAAAAALHPSIRELSRPASAGEPAPRHRRLVIYVVAGVVIPVTFVLQDATGGHFNTYLGVLGFLVIFLLVVIRMQGLITRVETQVDQLEAQRLELVASNVRKSSILESALDCIVSVDEAGRIVEFNPAAEETFGHRRANVLGRVMAETIIPEAFRDAHLAAFRRFMESGQGSIIGQRIEVVGLRADGTEFPLELTISAANDPDVGRMVTAFMRDATPRKERERLEEQLRQSQKMEAVGRLAGGVAHEFNNLLAVILNYSAFAREELDEKSSARRDLEEVLKAGNRAAELVRQLLAFSRKEVTRPQVLSLPEVLEGMMMFLRPLVGEDVSMTQASDPNIALVEADRSQLEQVVTNLIVNSRDALPQGGSIVISARNCDGTPAGLPFDPDAGSFVCIEVADTGVGMDGETLARVFEPFFTTKPTGVGTGLGLSMAYGFAVQVGGHLEIASTLGSGTVVSLYLPAAEAGEASPKKDTPGYAPAGTGERVLVIEDELEVARLVERILSRGGYEVVIETSPLHGLSLVRSGLEVDVVISDVVMPGMSGPEMVGHMRSLRPEVRTLFMSGYPDQKLAVQGLAGMPLLQKPFTAHDLLTSIRAVLDGTAALG